MATALPPAGLPVYTSEPPPRRRNRLGGCLLGGCVVLILLVVVPPVVLWASIASADDIPDNPRHEERTHVLGAPDENAPLRIDLDVKFSDLRIERGEPGSPLRLEADWEDRAFRLREELEGNVYQLRLEGRGLRFAFPFNDHELRGTRLVLTIPADQPVEIVGDVRMGQATLDLGGLALRGVDLDLGAGESNLDFSIPTSGQLERLRIDSSMGELEIEELGNASPRIVDLDHKMGDLRIDLGGAWRADANVKLHVGMGSARVSLPTRDQAFVEVERARMTMGGHRMSVDDGGPRPAGLPVVRLNASGGMGDLDIE